MTTPRIVTPPTRASIPPDAAVVLVHAAIAPVHAEPRVSSGQTTQALAAHPLRILARHDDDWLRVRGADGYEGWIHRGYVALPGDLGVTDPTSWPGDARTSLSASVSQPGGLQRALPLGAWLRPDEETLAGEALRPREREARFAPDGAAIARTAVERFAGTPYQWGGLTPWGADCSGLAQTAFGLHGVPLPRDAYQQAECGVDAAAIPSRSPRATSCSSRTGPMATSPTWASPWASGAWCTWRWDAADTRWRTWATHRTATWPR